MRALVVSAIPQLPQVFHFPFLTFEDRANMFNWSLLQAEQWVENLFGGDEELFERFLERHSESQAWTDGYGIICQVSKRRKFHLNLLSQATALVVGREIQVIGTNHKEQGGEVAKVSNEFIRIIVGTYLRFSKVKFPQI